MTEQKKLSSDDLMDKYQNIINLLEDTSSYKNEKEPCQPQNNQNNMSTFFRNTFLNLQNELVNVLEENIPDLINKYEAILIEYCTNHQPKIENISEKKDITSRGFDEYVVKLNNNIKLNNKICNHFSMQLSTINESNELGNIISFYVCRNCEYPYSSHNVCKKFIQSNKSEDSSNMCNTCGLMQNDHTHCSKFVYTYKQIKSDSKSELKQKLENMCGFCGLSHNDHISLKNVCNNFNDNKVGYCDTCDHHISVHIYNQSYHRLKDNIKSKISEDIMYLTIEAMRNPFFRLLTNDINNRIYVNEYTKLYEKQNNEGFHDYL